MKHVLISDTHGQNNLLKNLPVGDVLIHCGDALRYGSRAELHEFAEIYGALPHKFKILIAGNHGACFEKHAKEARKLCADAGIIYLEDSGITIEGISYWGMPWTPVFCEWHFMADETKIYNKITLAPVGVDVLITHGPPKYILDLAGREHAGSLTLSDAVSISIQPKLHVFGHIHEGYGTQRYGNIDFVNCSLLDGYYQPINLPIIYELDLPAS